MARKKESYEEKFSKLTDIVDVMENSQLTLEESMKKYEEGIKLCNDLYKILNGYEGKIKILSGENEEEFSIE
ncbi:exodeoxyribonuclease VII small subunit [Clostridium senegalense]|uniref:exodeoxyribonuclease VII small subunit n=1 Tax=Clostridium senegalense TaxID=1465809 RepID=UPI001C0F7A0E|nr:exodeoxyribonuclease VII small subunit [Clostridium senegalense]MBU5225299.1 exodeoxyribonuclease VII small subunit [Clostridium senegalense]